MTTEFIYLSIGLVIFAIAGFTLVTFLERRRDKQI